MVATAKIGGQWRCASSWKRDEEAAATTELTTAELTLLLQSIHLSPSFFIVLTPSFLPLFTHAKSGGALRVGSF